VGRELCSDEDVKSLDSRQIYYKTDKTEQQAPLTDGSGSELIICLQAELGSESAGDDSCDQKTVI
jgi:hypothetical protein